MKKIIRLLMFVLNFLCMPKSIHALRKHSDTRRNKNKKYYLFCMQAYVLTVSISQRTWHRESDIKYKLCSWSKPYFILCFLKFPSKNLPELIKAFKIFWHISPMYMSDYRPYNIIYTFKNNILLNQAIHTSK